MLSGTFVKNKDEQDPESRRRRGEKIDGRGLRQMICQERSPSLGRRFAWPRQISGHCGLRHRNPQFEQFSKKAARFPGPMPGEGSAAPTEDCVGRNHLQTSPPTGPESVQHNPSEPIAVVEAQATRRVLLENRELVTKREDLRLQGSAGSKTGG